ncbi:nucleolar protein 58 [Zootermopsis nevadensis]|uniref:Nucleolar protein 58 n=1 Tax=Zootermopsis nevadensis TaxID=136037 RepID=A0A067RI98_ZOONE|nr:nucleolar protein 58 [Zootermopsis nevadensis]KDR23571.1 Nucleolar protein 58 [Zootermopsis nevadensis]
MLVLFETPAGYAIFKLLDQKKLTKTENLYHDFETPEAASRVVKLKHFEKFTDTTEALAATTAAVEGKMSKSLKKMLKNVVAKDLQEQLLVADAKLGNAIKDKLNLSCLSNTSVQELMRCIRSQMDSLLAGFPKKEMTAMALGLAHSLSRYKLKFSPDKIDTMIVQAICLLDDLDKELNNYIMRCREWYGWHFPELGKIITDNIAFVKTVRLIGTRECTSSTDLSDILPEEVEAKVKDAAEISMGTEISEDDIMNIQHLCDQVIEISSYRSQLYDYLRSRMMAMAPNLTVLVGELVGARLISHAGSLINLAKHPASTVQILGAEKALFRALKTKKDTPKYGLIFHTTLVGQTSTVNKGKISRMLAAKAALATRVDALGEDCSLDLGAEHKVKVEARIRFLEEGNLRRISGTGKAKAKLEKYHSKSEVRQYPVAADSTLPTRKRKFDEMKESPRKALIEEITDENDVQPKKKKKIKHEPVGDIETTGHGEERIKKKKKIKSEPAVSEGITYGDGVEAQEEEEQTWVTESGKKKKRKKKFKEATESGVGPDDSFGGSFVEAETNSEKKKKKKKKKSLDNQEED